MPPVTINIDLPDINVWLALIDPDSPKQQTAQHYWENVRTGDIVFCRVTMMGLLRLSTSRKVMRKNVFTHEEAWEMYRTFIALPDVLFLPETDNIENTFAALSQVPEAPHHLWTDAYLAAFAITNNARIVSFDSDFTRFPALNFLHLKA
ncbi:MAG: PIN domain-containing protein [Luteolibacter sp.]